MSTHEDEDAEVHTQVDLQMDVDGQTEPEHLSYDEAEDAQTEEAEQTQKEEDEGHDTRKEVKDGGVDAEVEKQGKGKSKPKREPPELKREPGKSVFPFSRVQKIMKADKDLPVVSREAVFLISRATEEFIARIAQASQMYAGKESRNTVQRRDIALAVRRADEYWFLEEIIPWHDPEAEQRRKPKALQKDAEDESRPKTMLDRFVMHVQDTDGAPSETGGDDDVVMNEDGTMSMVPETHASGIDSSQ